MGGQEGKRRFSCLILERVKDSSPIQIATTVPTLAERQGDFSQTNTLDADSNVLPITDLRSSLRTSRFAESVCLQRSAEHDPASMLNPIGLKVAQLYPAPNLPGDPLLGTNNYRTNVLSTSQGLPAGRKNRPAVQRATSAHRCATPGSAAIRTHLRYSAMGIGMTAFTSDTTVAQRWRGL